MKTIQKIMVVLAGATCLFGAWAYGVGMGRVSADKGAMHNMMVNSVIILDEIEKGKPDSAANWCKSFIVQGSRGRDCNPSPIVGFLYFMRYHDLPILDRKMASRVQQVTDSYRPNIIDLSGYIVKDNQSGFTIEIPINKRERSLPPDEREPSRRDASADPSSPADAP